MNPLTVGELITELQNYDQDTPVVSCISYGDRDGTMQAVPATELNECFIAETAYSDTGFKVVENGDRDEDDQAVVVLNYDFL